MLGRKSFEEGREEEEEEDPKQAKPRSTPVPPLLNTPESRIQAQRHPNQHARLEAAQGSLDAWGSCTFSGARP